MKTYKEFIDENFDDEEEIDEAGMQTQRQTAGDKLRFKLANMGAKGMKKKAAARKGITKLRRKQAMRMRTASGIKSVGRKHGMTGKLKLRKAFTSKGYAGKKKQKAAAGSKTI